jgi:hypothetical protein
MQSSDVIGAAPPAATGIRRECWNEHENGMLVRGSSPRDLTLHQPLETDDPGQAKALH